MKLPDLTIPLPGSTTARTVLSRAIGRLLGDLRDVLRKPVEDPLLRRDVQSFAAAMGTIRDRQAALATVLRHVNVGALVRCARIQSVVEPELLSELIATLALELSVLGALERPIELQRMPRRIVSSLGGFVVEEPRAPISAALGENARRPFFSIDREIVLALEDNNPLSMLEAHPRKSGNRIDLGGHSEDEWCASLRDSLRCIERYLPDLRAEIDLYVQQFVPVGYDAESHLSASYREAIGTIYLTLHPQPMTMTEAVIHEFSHNKLNALFELDDVLHNAFFPLFKSPVRPDPRPLHGVLLAVHAFIPVARLYEAMKQEGDPMAGHASFEQRFRKIIEGNHEGMEVLRAHADGTPLGREVLAELDRWERHFSAGNPLD